MGLRPLVERVLSEIWPTELEQELKFLVAWVSRLGREVDLFFLQESVVMESEG
jgi:hypothetical protein